MAGRRLNSLLLVIFTGPGAVGVSTLVLWENEGRFDYYRAALETTIITSPSDAAPQDAVSLTGALDFSIVIAGEYVDRLTGYLRVRRFAEIYSWEESEDDEGNTEWTQSWYARVEPNYRNDDILQVLSNSTLYPPIYRLGVLEISPARIHVVDSYAAIAADRLQLSADGSRIGLDATREYLYLRQTPNTTTLGDERLTYLGVTAEPEASYFGRIEDGVGVGKQYETNESFISELIGNDGLLHHLVNGGRDEALSTVRSDFIMTKWLVRVGGTFGMIFGFWLLFGRFASLLYHQRRVVQLPRHPRLNGCTC